MDVWRVRAWARKKERAMSRKFPDDGAYTKCQQQQWHCKFTHIHGWYDKSSRFPWKCTHNVHCTHILGKETLIRTTEKSNSNFAYIPKQLGTRKIYAWFVWNNMKVVHRGVNTPRTHKVNFEMRMQWVFAASSTATAMAEATQYRQKNCAIFRSRSRMPAHISPCDTCGISLNRSGSAPPFICNSFKLIRFHLKWIVAIPKKLSLTS